MQAASFECLRTGPLGGDRGRPDRTCVAAGRRLRRAGCGAGERLAEDGSCKTENKRFTGTSVLRRIITALTGIVVTPDDLRLVALAPDSSEKEVSEETEPEARVV